MAIELHSGSPTMIDYTPAAAVTAGNGVAIGAKMCVAHRDIAANELGALAYPGGNAVYRITLATGNSYDVGDPVTVNPATHETNAAAGSAFGVCVGQNVDQATGDTVVYATHDN